MNEFKTDKLNGNNRRYNAKYINRFMGAKCSVDLLSRNLFPNAKEITESFAALEAMKYLPVSFGGEFNVISVGDGYAPRTSAVFAFLTKWNCISVDPLLKKTDWNINRLTCHKEKIENLTFEFDKPCIILMVHSHAKVDKTLAAISAPKRHLVTIECCYKLDVQNVAPDFNYEDDQIWSTKNNVKIWANV